jgi:hypothetical protein
MPLFGPPDVNKLSANRDLNGLSKALTYPKDARVRKNAAEGLGKLGDPAAVPALIAALGDRDADVRMEAAVALGRIKDPAAVGALIAAVQDSAPQVRGCAVAALGTWRFPSAVAALIAALRDSDANVVDNAISALGRIGNRSAAEPLVAMLAEERTRTAVVLALGHIRDRRVIDPIRAAYGTSRIPHVVSIELAKMGDPRSVGDLARDLKEKPTDETIEVLEKLRDPGALPALLELAGSEGTHARRALAAAHHLNPELDPGKFNLVSCWAMIYTNVYTLQEHNLTRAEYDRFVADKKVQLPQTYEHSGHAAGCRACENLIKEYLKKLLPRLGRMPVGYELGDGYRNTVS